MENKTIDAFKSIDAIIDKYGNYVQDFDEYAQKIELNFESERLANSFLEEIKNVNDYSLIVGDTFSKSYYEDNDGFTEVTLYYTSDAMDIIYNWEE